MSPGERGQTGERGPAGDHGQTGSIGSIGLPGIQGERGFTGKPGTTPLVVRYATAAYAILCLGLVFTVSFLYNLYLHDKVEERRTLERRRGDLIGTCAKDNELRQAIRDVVNTAYRSRPIPPGTSERDSLPLLEANLLREQERVSQLAHPGLKDVDCELAYPLKNFQ